MANLPVLNPLVLNQSNYIQNTKALLDFDIAVAKGTPYYFSTMVALNIPNYLVGGLYFNLNSIGISATDPNVIFPKACERYMENILRQEGVNENIAELAFYKLLNKGGMSYQQIRNSVVFKNEIHTSNFQVVEGTGNNGWSEVVGIIPNNCKEILNIPYTNTLIDDIITTDDLDKTTALYDNSLREFIFSQPESKQVIDFDNITFKPTGTAPSSFDFNCLLIFYKDNLGFDKLHGINFINPFDDKITFFELPRYKSVTNDARSVGYSFKHNLKTCLNDSTKTIIEQNTDGYWTTHLETLSLLSSYLKKDMLIKSAINPV
jgi:hypothetical protein